VSRLWWVGSTQPLRLRCFVELLSRACLQPRDLRLEDPTNATPPGRTLGAAAQPGNPVSASGAAGRARAVVEGAITPALRPRPPPKRARATPTRASGNRVCLQPREGWLAAWREPPRPSRH